VIKSKEQLLATLATLEECRTALVANGNPETAHLVSVAALDIRVKLGQISEDELIAVCEAAQPAAAPVPRSGTRGLVSFLSSRAIEHLESDERASRLRARYDAVRGRCSCWVFPPSLPSASREFYSRAV